MKKKKLILFQPRLLPYKVDMLNFLAKKFKAKFLFFTKKVAKDKATEGGIVQVADYNNRLKGNKQYLLNGLSLFNKDIYRFGIFKNLKLFNPDIIITYEYSLSTILSIIFKKIYKKKYKIFTMTEDNVYTFRKRKKLRYLAFLISSKFVDGIMLVNKNIKSTYKKIINKSCSLLYNPIIQDEKRFRSDLKKTLKLSRKNFLKFKLHGKKIILFVGRLSPEKNIEHLITSFSKVSDPSLRLFIIGYGRQYQILKTLSLKLNCSKKIFFLGKLENLKLYSWYNVAQLFVLPSSWEPFGAVVNESLLSGVKVICSNRAGATSLLNKSNGLIFNLNKKDELSNFLKKETIKLNPTTLKNLRNIKKNLMPYSFNSIGDRLIKDLSKNSN